MLLCTSVHRNNMQILLLLKNQKIFKKGSSSGSVFGSGSIFFRVDPVPHLNKVDPKHRLFLSIPSCF